jgi:hypothetical protein
LTLKANVGQNLPLSMGHIEEMTQQIHPKKDEFTTKIAIQKLKMINQNKKL